MSRTLWTRHDLFLFVEWHESVIAQYPANVQEELRQARRAWLGKVPR
jgi:hypothetical protein